MSSKTIAFKLKIDVNGKENIVSAIVPAQELGKAINQAKEAAATAKTKIFDFNQAAMAFKNAGEAVSTLNQALGSFATAYQNVEVANKRLQTVMEERMAATTADIASVKDLISAQTQLGIIGGSVQKAGAQQVATFLTQKESLLTLIPALNDLIAQQKGLNASEQDAQAIGNLFGKVMQGQTSALKRVGITFTEAQEQVLKMGTEQERAAMLAEVVTANVGHMNAALGTTASGNMKQFSNRIAGIKVKIGEFANTIQPTLSMITSFTMLLSSAGGAIAATRTALTLLGGTVTMVSTFFKGVWVQSVRLAQATVVALRATVYTANVSFKAWRAGSITLTAALRGVAVGATTAKMAIRGLLASTIIGAALVALGYALEKLIDYLTGSADAADQETEALNANTEAVDRNAERRKAIQSVQDDAASRYSDERNKVKQLTDVIHDNTASLADRQTAIRNLQAIIPSYQASIAKDGSIFNENTAAVNSYIDSLTDLAAAEAAFDAIKKSFEQEIGIRQAYNFWNKKYAQTSDQIKALNGDKDYVTTDTPHSNPVGNLQDQLRFHPTTPTAPTADINKGTDFNANPIAQAAHARQADRDRNKQEQKILAQRATAQDKANKYGGQLRDIADFRENVLAMLTPGARARYDTMRANGGYIAGAGLGAPTQATPGKGGGHATPHTATGGANTTPQPQEGSLKYYDDQIAKLREEAQATSDVTEAQAKLAQAAALTAQRKDLAIRLGIEAPDKTEVRDKMDVLQELLHNAEKDYEQADTTETKEFALNRINIWKNQIEALQAQRITLQLEVDPQGAKQTIQDLRRTKYSQAQTRANTVQSDLADGLIDEAEANRQIKQINHDLETQIGKGFKPITLQVDTDEAEHGIKHFTTESRKAWSGITSGVDAVTSLTETLQGNGTVWEKLTAVINTFFTVMDSVSAIMEVVNALTKVSTATKQADTTATETNTTTSVSNTTAKAGEALAGAAASGSSLPFPANIAAIAAAVAAVVAVIATISSLTFASGGIVPGTSYTGDRITARVNSGEMILNPRQQANLWRLANTPIAIPTTNAQAINPTTPTLNLAALRASLQAPSVNVNLSGRIRGRDIITVLANETRTNRRPTNIHI